MMVLLPDRLEYVHKHNIIHRDVKCANILLSNDYTPWITDFGFSRFIDKVNTMTGETGSYRYMAPEIIRASKYSGKADVYSFAVSLLLKLRSDLCLNVQVCGICLLFFLIRFSCLESVDVFVRFQNAMLNGFSFLSQFIIARCDYLLMLLACLGCDE